MAAIQQQQQIQLKPEEKQREYDETLALIYSELEKILEKRPKNPVSAFATR